jgi:hypothetical protein
LICTFAVEQKPLLYLIPSNALPQKDRVTMLAWCGTGEICTSQLGFRFAEIVLCGQGTVAIENAPRYRWNNACTAASYLRGAFAQWLVSA